MNGGGTTEQIVDVLIHHAATGGNTAPACPLHPPALQKQALHSCYGNGGGSHQLHPISVGVRQGLNASVLRHQLAFADDGGAASSGWQA